MINKLLIARARMGSSTPAWSEDSLEKMGAVGTVFKYLLCAFGPLTSKADVARLSGLEANSGECEPAFLIAAAAYGLTFSSPPAYAANLVLAAVTSRFLHGFFFVIVPAQPWRALSFLVPTGVTLYLSAEVIAAYRFARN
jgi:MAPEG family